MASLSDMMTHKLIKRGDTISFTFKGNHFSATILDGGMIGKCTIKRVHDTEPQEILKQTVAFSSLTAWTEACLQDIMEEYYTRYSSWKRVIHSESKRSMGDIRDQCKLMDPTKAKDDTNELYKEIIRLHGTIDEMNYYIQRIHNGESIPFKQWSYLNIKPQQQVPRTIQIDETIDMEIHDEIQEIACNGNLKQYLRQ
jgi:hypothetical protein